MFKRILMPVDLSDQHEAALNMAAELCRPGDGEIILIHAIEVIAGLNVEEERPFYDRLERIARAQLSRLGQQLDRKQVRWRIEIRLGQRVPEIVQYAREIDADLVVLSTPRPDPANLLAGLGSVGVRVGLVVPCPVLLVR
jgi:nucleotide-binding universal stress UspA family protein